MFGKANPLWLIGLTKNEILENTIQFKNFGTSNLLASGYLVPKFMICIVRKDILPIVLNY